MNENFFTKESLSVDDRRRVLQFFFPLLACCWCWWCCIIFFFCKTLNKSKEREKNYVSFTVWKTMKFLIRLLFLFVFIALIWTAKTFPTHSLANSNSHKSHRMMNFIKQTLFMKDDQASLFAYFTIILTLISKFQYPTFDVGNFITFHYCQRKFEVSHHHHHTRMETFSFDLWYFKSINKFLHETWNKKALALT